MTGFVIDPIASGRDVFPLGPAVADRLSERAGGGGVRPFGLRFVRPATSGDGVDLSGVSYDRVAQVSVYEGVAWVDGPLAAETFSTPYRTQHDHQTFPDTKTDRLAPRRRHQRLVVAGHV